jgi:hypothetical protein
MVKTYSFSKDDFTRTLIPRDEVLYLHTKVSRSNYKSDTITERTAAHENVFYIPDGGYIRFPSFDLDVDKFISTTMLLLLSQYGKRERALTGDHKVARNVEMRRLDLNDSNNLILFLNFILDNPSNARRLKSKRRVKTRAVDAPKPPSKRP